jgi:hypothetical protein
LTEMATLGGSTRSDPLGVPLVGGTDGSFAANARVPTNVINAAASGVSRKPRRVSKIGISICVLSSSRIIRNSRENINVIPDGLLFVDQSTILVHDYLFPFAQIEMRQLSLDPCSA